MKVEIGVGGLLFIVFLVMKLTHYIAWSWWWVTSPLWIPWVLVLSIAGVLGGFSWIASALGDFKDARSFNKRLKR